MTVLTVFKPLILWFVQPCACEHLVQGSYLPSKGPQGTEDVSAEEKSEDKKQSEGGLQYIPQQEKCGQTCSLCGTGSSMMLSWREFPLLFLNTIM